MTLEDDMQTLLLLSSLSDNWEIFVVTISNSALNGVLTMDIVKDSMQNKETRRKSSDVCTGSDYTHALVADDKRRNKNRWYKGRNKSRGQSKSKDKRLVCYHCEKMGHVKRNCQIWLKEQKECNNQKNEDDKDTTVVVTINEDVLLCVEGYCLHVNDSIITWIIDSGASFHVCSNIDLFVNYKDCDFGITKMGNTSQSKIVGIGDIYFQTELGCLLMLKDVRHIVDMSLNLILVLAFDRLGYHNNFDYLK